MANLLGINGAYAPSAQSAVIPEIMAPVSPIVRDFAHADVSTRYHHVTTQDVIDSLCDSGWSVDKTAIARVRRPDKQGFQKHFVWMRCATGTLEVGDTELRLLMMNAHDGTCAYRLMAGLHRKVCSNGLVISVGEFAYISIRHTAEDIREQAIEGAQKIAALAPAIDANIKLMQSIQLSPEQQMVFAQQTIKLVWPDKSETYVNPNELLGARRETDKEPNLWNVYNRVQENVTRGGLYTNSNRQTRSIRGANRDLQFNRDLFALAASFAK